MALKVIAVDKPIAGISLGDIPAEMVELFEQVIPAALKNEQELQFDGDTKDEAEQAAAYARVWGIRQDPKLEIRRIGAKLNGQPSTRVRLTVKVFDPDAPRPGRPAASKK